jgi:hypothetical protein
LHIVQKRLARISQARGVVDHQPRRLDVDGHARQLELDALEVGNRLAELLALLGVFDGVIERALRQADHLRANPDAPLVQGFDGDLVALAGLAEDAVLRHQTVFEQQLAGAAGADAEFVLFLADREPLGAALDDERGDAAIPGLRVDVREHEEDVGFVAVGDPQLAAVDDIPVPGFGRARLERKGVAARTGLGEAVRADRAGGELGQIALLDVAVAPAHERVDDERVLDVDQHPD